MIIGGFIKQSLIDYPGNLASVIFTLGCNFRCFYCHNPELVLPERYWENKLFSEDEILAYLTANKILLDAVVITGGEPTIHIDLPEFIYKIKKLDLLVKLDTNGTNPVILKDLIDNKLIDYVAMDIKSPLELEKYRKIVGKQFNVLQMDNISKSIKIIEQAKVSYEFRSTLIKDLHSTDDINQMIQCLSGNYYLQEFNPNCVLQAGSDSYNRYTNTDLQKYLVSNGTISVHIR